MVGNYVLFFGALLKITDLGLLMGNGGLLKNLLLLLESTISVTLYLNLHFIASAFIMRLRFLSARVSP